MFLTINTCNLNTWQRYKCPTTLHRSSFNIYGDIKYYANEVYTWHLESGKTPVTLTGIYAVGIEF